jgi:hypothetical protein
VVNEVYRVIVWKPGHPDQFPYIDYWQDVVLSRPIWLRPCLKETWRIMVARVAATSKCGEKTKEPVLAEEPEEMPMCHFIHLCNWHPVLHLHLQHCIGKLEGQSHL